MSLIPKSIKTSCFEGFLLLMLKERGKKDVPLPTTQCLYALVVWPVSSILCGTSSRLIGYCSVNVDDG